MYHVHDHTQPSTPSESCCGVDAVDAVFMQAVAEQTDWQEAALQAQQLLGGNTLDNGDPMRD